MSLVQLKDFFQRGNNLPHVVIIAALAVAGLPLLAIGMYRNVNDSDTRNNQVNLEQEFREFKPLPQAKELNYASSQKTGLAYIEARYETDLAIDEAGSYYEQQLVTHGWLFYEDERLRSYCKGKYKATLFCGQQDNKSRSEIVLKWGFESLVERYITGDKYRSHGCTD